MNFTGSANSVRLLFGDSLNRDTALKTQMTSLEARLTALEAK